VTASNKPNRSGEPLIDHARSRGGDFGGPNTRALRIGSLLAGLAFGPKVADAQTMPITIVSVGDSYASGQGAANTAATILWDGDNRDGAAVGCWRSTLAAPALAARTVGSQRPVANFIHVACSGATIAALTGSGGQLATAARIAGGPIDALIISIGGNDVGFATLVGSCLALPCYPAIPIAVPASIPALTSGLGSLAAAVSALPVPVRHVFVTEYPEPSTTPFLPPHHRCGGPFTPNIPGHGFDLLDFAKAELASLTVIAPLNGTLAAAVTSANASRPPGGPVWHYVAGISAAFHGSGYCMGIPNPAFHMWFPNRMVNTIGDSFTTQRDAFGAMHPNAAGQAAAGAVIAAAIAGNLPIVRAGGGPSEPAVKSCPSSRPKCCEPHEDGSCGFCVGARASCP
jgi:lysophospholipase L1-like esterase